MPKLGPLILNKPLFSASVTVGLFLCCTEELKAQDIIPVHPEKLR